MCCTIGTYLRYRYGKYGAYRTGTYIAVLCCREGLQGGVQSVEPHHENVEHDLQGVRTQGQTSSSQVRSRSSCGQHNVAVLVTTLRLTNLETN